MTNWIVYTISIILIIALIAAFSFMIATATNGQWEWAFWSLLGMNGILIAMYVTSAFYDPINSD